jgi:hypothetical protein
MCNHFPLPSNAPESAPFIPLGTAGRPSPALEAVRLLSDQCYNHADNGNFNNLAVRMEKLDSGWKIVQIETFEDKEIQN